MVAGPQSHYLSCLIIVSFNNCLNEEKKPTFENNDLLNLNN